MHSRMSARAHAAAAKSLSFVDFFRSAALESARISHSGRSSVSSDCCARSPLSSSVSVSPSASASGASSPMSGKLSPVSLS
ncbi:MAG: hypothetical protein PUC27_01475 [Clostridium sp.]|nr:hypothetical protein [Clostridium sp.]